MNTQLMFKIFSGKPLLDNEIAEIIKDPEGWDVLFELSGAMLGSCVWQ